jgi:hypothetical protein
MQFQRSSALPLFRRVALPSMFLLLTFATAGRLSAQSQQTPATATPSDQQAPPPQPAAPPAMTDAQSSSSTDVQTAHVLQQPKDPYKRDVAVSAFAQVSQYINGNSIRTDTTSSGGAMVSLRQSPRWWFGYEANYGYTKYTDTYYFGTYRIKHNTNEFSLAYLIDRNVYRGLHVFGSLGAGAIIFSPTEHSGAVNIISSAPPTQSLPLFVYSLGVQKLVTRRVGVRVQYRSDTYKDPNFKFEALNTHKLRSSYEPSAGVYYRF